MLSGAVRSDMRSHGGVEASLPGHVLFGGREAATANQQLLALRVLLRMTFLEFLPDSARVGSHHLLSGLAAEGLREFRHIRHDVVDAEYGQRVRIRSNEQPGDLRAKVGAPRVSV